MITQADIREYTAQAHSTELFGRVLCNARNHHFVVDGPLQNGCPGEEITPGELFLSGIAACGVELVQVIAKERNLPLPAIKVTIRGILDRSQPVRQDVTVFNRIWLQFSLKGLTTDQSNQLVETFKGR
jgi:uncharacterized OsmC-like protein